MGFTWIASSYYQTRLLHFHLLCKLIAWHLFRQTSIAWMRWILRLMLRRHLFRQFRLKFSHLLTDNMFVIASNMFQMISLSSKLCRSMLDCSSPHCWVVFVQISSPFRGLLESYWGCGTAGWVSNYTTKYRHYTTTEYRVSHSAIILGLRSTV